MEKVVTHTQFKNEWDHLRKQWKAWKECFEHDTRLGYDSVTGKLEASDEWWTQKLQVSSFYIIMKNSTVYSYIVF